MLGKEFLIIHFSATVETKKLDVVIQDLFQYRLFICTTFLAYKKNASSLSSSTSFVRYAFADSATTILCKSHLINMSKIHILDLSIVF